MREICEILDAIDSGQAVDTNRLVPAVYAELRAMAIAMLAQESPGHTLQATALVHEAYLRLHRELDERTPFSSLAPRTADPPPVSTPSDASHSLSPTNDDEQPSRSDGTRWGWNSRAHFFSAAAEAMRRILVDAARRRKRQKRGGDRQRVDIDPAELLLDAPPDDLLDIHDALEKLEAKDGLKAQVVKLRYFAGLTIEETAKALGISEPTVKRHWAYARAWLRREALGWEHGDENRVNS